MGKIADALEKYAQESKTARLPVLTRADLDVLLSYNQQNGHLLTYDNRSDHMVNGDMAALRNRETIKRLLDNKLIYPNGNLTPKGLEECKRLRASRSSGSIGSQAPDESERGAHTTFAPAQKEGKNRSENQPLSENHTEIIPLDTKEEPLSSEDIYPVSQQLIPREDPPGADETAPSVDQGRKPRRGKRGKLHTAATQIKPYVPAHTAADTSLEQSHQVESMAFARYQKADKRAETDQRAGGVKAIQFDPKTIDRNLVSLLNPQSYEAEQFKILRTNLLFPVSGSSPQSILVTGALPGDGKSFVSANLAVSIALNINRHVLLIDCDLRKPDLNRLFGIGETPGLSDYLQGRQELEALLVRIGIDKLSLLPAGPVPPNPSELMSSDRMAELIKEVKQRYSDRLIVIDSPPPDLAAETTFLARNVDGVILVVKYGKTSQVDVENIIKSIGFDKIFGCVLNQFENPVSRYNGYKKYKKYGKRY